MSSQLDLMVRAWPVFLEVTGMGRTISYSELAGRVGPPLHHRHIHRQLLSGLSRGCCEASLPDLAALVVRRDSGLPGLGWFHSIKDQNPERRWAEMVQECYRYPWPTRPPVSLLDALKTSQSP